MLKASDLAGYDLAALAAGLLAASARRGLSHRACARLLAEADARTAADAGPDRLPDQGFPEVREAVTAMDAESALFARAADAFTLIQRFIADEGHRKPAPVVRLVPPSRPPALDGGSLLARACRALTGGTGSGAPQDAGPRRANLERSR